jgi:hypothetical protein
MGAGVQGCERNGLVATVIPKTPDKAGSVRATAASRTRLGFLQDGDVGVGVIPDLKEVLVGAFGLGGLTCHRVNTRFEDEPVIPRRS